jgi:hypothetical protein
LALAQTTSAIMANGSVERESMIVTNSVVIAGRTAYGVEATVSGETVIVGLPLLYKISGGKFSFDHGSLVFGG